MEIAHYHGLDGDNVAHNGAGIATALDLVDEMGGCNGAGGGHTDIGRDPCFVIFRRSATQIAGGRIEVLFVGGFNFCVKGQRCARCAHAHGGVNGATYVYAHSKRTDSPCKHVASGRCPTTVAHIVNLGGCIGQIGIHHHPCGRHGRRSVVVEGQGNGDGLPFVGDGRGDGRR